MKRSDKFLHSMPKRMNAKYKMWLQHICLLQQNHPSIFALILADHDMMESEMTYFFQNQLNFFLFTVYFWRTSVKNNRKCWKLNENIHWYNIETQWNNSEIINAFLGIAICTKLVGTIFLVPWHCVKSKIDWHK